MGILKSLLRLAGLWACEQCGSRWSVDRKDCLTCADEVRHAAAIERALERNAEWNDAWAEESAFLATCAFCEKPGCYQVSPERVALSYESCKDHLSRCVDLCLKYDTNEGPVVEVTMGLLESMKESLNKEVSKK